VVVILYHSVISLVPLFPNLSALRSFRVLRPLRSISKLPGLRKIIGALLESARDLTNVMLVLAFLVVCFSITGMQFWKGLLHARCRITPYPVVMPLNCDSIFDSCWNDYINNVTENPAKYRCVEDENDSDNWTQSTSPWFVKGPQDCIWPINDNDERVCSLFKGEGYACSSTQNIGNKHTTYTCGSNFDLFGNPRFVNDVRPYGYPRMMSGTFLDALNWGYTNYDSFLSAFLTSFQIVTLEGWSDIMYQVMDVWPKLPTAIIFSFHVILCGYIILNLVLAVITKSIDEHEELAAKHRNDNNKTLRSSCVEMIDMVDSPDSRVCSTDNYNSSGNSHGVFGNESLRKLIEMRCYSILQMSCVIVNTIILSFDHYGISERNQEYLENANAVFTVIFILDVIVGNVALGMKGYWG